MKIYVASKFENKARVRDLMETLREDGHTITFDWTTCSEPERARLGMELAPYRERAALQDLAGVLACDALVCLTRPNMKGAYVEQGIAIAAGTPVIIVGPVDGPAGWHIFEHLPHDVYRVNTIAEARATLKAIELTEVVSDWDNEPTRGNI